MEKELFYNPVWTPYEESILLWCCEVPKEAQIKSIQALEWYLKFRYKHLSNQAYQEHGNDIYSWYHDFIDDNPGYNDQDSLIDCLFQSDKYWYQRNLLERRIVEGKTPDIILSTEEAQNICEGASLYSLFYAYYEYYIY